VIYKTKIYWHSQKYRRTTRIAGYKIYAKTGFVTTSTWSAVSETGSWWGFYQYMTLRRRARVKEYRVLTSGEVNAFIKDCRVGDILQIRNKNSRTKFHSVIVTKKTYNSKKKIHDMELCYHTSDRKSVSFRNFAWEGFGKDSYWTCIKPYIT